MGIVQPPDWRTEGVRGIGGDRLDTNTAQTPGMLRAAAIDFRGSARRNSGPARCASIRTPRPGPIITGRWKASSTWCGARPACAGASASSSPREAEAGDFIFVPPYVPHQEINALSDAPLECVLVRSDNESVVVNLNIDAAERVEEIYWIDPIHRRP